MAEGKDAFLGAAVSLGLAAAAAGTEIDQLSEMLNDTGYHGLVHGDACPDNVLEEDHQWGTTTMWPRLLTWLDSFTTAAARSGALPGLRALASDLHEQLSAR